MARRRTSSNFRSSSSRPNRSWSESYAAAYITVPAASKVLLATLVTATPGGVDLTILRTVGGIAVRSDQGASNEIQIGAWGMILITDLAAAAGIASIPSPATDAGDDWFVHQSFAQSGMLADEGVVGRWYPIDSKAKRMLDGTGIVVAVVAENLHATQGLAIADMSRVLTQVRGTR